MKKLSAFIFFVFFAFFPAGCGDSSGGSKKSGAAADTNTVTILINGSEDDDITLYAEDEITLSAIVKDKDGNTVDSAAFAWTASEGMGVFSNNASGTTVFTVAAASMDGDGLFIKAACGAIAKTIKIKKVDNLKIYINVTVFNPPHASL
jgi:hypothetical protein